MKDSVSVSLSVSSSVSAPVTPSPSVSEPSPFKRVSGYLSRFQSLRRSWLIGGMAAALFCSASSAASSVTKNPTDAASLGTQLSASQLSAKQLSASQLSAKQLSAKQLSANREVTLRWQPSYNATHYRVEQSTDGGQTFTAFAPVNTTEKVLSLAPGLYHFRVMSCIEHHRTLEVLCDGVGQYSDVLTFDSRVDDDNNVTLN